MSLLTIDSYIGLLQHLSREMKQELISRLSDSLKSSNPKKTANLDGIFGAWEDPRSADEIIEDLKTSRNFNSEREVF